MEKEAFQAEKNDLSMSMWPLEKRFSVDALRTCSVCVLHDREKAISLDLALKSNRLECPYRQE